MKRLIHCCGHGGSENGADIYASLPLDEEPTVGTRYAVTRSLSPSGVAELLEYRLTDASLGRTKEWPHTHWSLFLKSVPKPPEDPCGDDFMRKISS